MFGSRVARSFGGIAVLFLGGAALSCSPSKPFGDSGPSSPESGAGAAKTVGTGTTSAQRGPVRLPLGRPPTIEDCRALAKPDGAACEWVLFPGQYCGGPAPPPEVYWPRCYCEACAQDSDCPAGERCVTLRTDTECGPPKNLCLGARSPCDDKGGCGKEEQCMWIDGEATCKVPTIYPPRP